MTSLKEDNVLYLLSHSYHSVLSDVRVDTTDFLLSLLIYSQKGKRD